uniref:Topbp1 n=1 Tax=Solanum tuberosum TaxID=4113 RepID=M1ABI7_SOLTU
MSQSILTTPSNCPFSGLVICVTGLSKEARKQVMEATERLGGKYSPHLHPQCTHLVVQISFCFCISFSLITIFHNHVLFPNLVNDTFLHFFQLTTYLFHTYTSQRNDNRIGGSS